MLQVHECIYLLRSWIIYDGNKVVSPEKATVPPPSDDRAVSHPDPAAAGTEASTAQSPILLLDYPKRQLIPPHLWLV